MWVTTGIIRPLHTTPCKHHGIWHRPVCCFFLIVHTAVSRKVVLQKRKSEGNNVESFMGNDGFVLDWLKPKVLRRKRRKQYKHSIFSVYSCILFPQPSSVKLLLPIIPIVIVARDFAARAILCSCETTFVETTVSLFKIGRHFLIFSGLYSAFSMSQTLLSKLDYC